MPINPNIPLGVQQYQAPSMVDSYSKGMTLRNLAQQQKMQDMQMQDYEAQRPYQQQKQQQDLESGQLGIDSARLQQIIQRTAAIKDVFDTVTPETYPQAYEWGMRTLGPDVMKNVPRQYDEGFISMQRKQIAQSVDELNKAVIIGPDGQPTLNQLYFDGKNREAEIENRNRAPEAPQKVDVINLQFPDGRTVGVASNDTNGINQALQQGAVETGAVRPPTSRGGAMSASAQKELFEADDMIASSQNAIDILNSIIAPDPKTGKSQNDLAYSGGFAGMRKAAASFIPGTTEATDASVDLENKVTGQALESLKAIFGGMPTEGERKILLELQGSLKMEPSQRKAVFQRAIAMAQKRMDFNRQKAEKLRAGTYFSNQSDDADSGWSDL